MRKVLTVLLIVLLVLVVLIAALYAGFQIKPAPFDDYAERTPPLDTVPVPDGLPAPVARFYAVITDGTGDVPVLTSAVLTGRAEMRIGINFQARFRFTHNAGHAYRHYIEGTCYGLPLLKVNERYVDGVSRMELPFGTTENEPQVNQAANLGLWGESVWLPSIFVTDERVRWEAIDDNTALLIVPFEDGEDTFTVQFDAQSGLITEMTAQRYKDENADEKIAWSLRLSDWEMRHGLLIPLTGAAQWADEDDPWATFHIEDVVYNVDVADYLRQKGL